MRLTGFAAVLLLCLSACGGSENGADAGMRDATPPPAPVPPADAQGHVNAVPATPAPGEARAGGFYDIYLLSPMAADEQIAITVFEPAVIEGGKKYPLVLEQHGFGFSRKKNLNDNPTTALLSGISIAPFVQAGYGVISIDQRGHGESGGTIRAMDPDYEGRNLVAILDWAEAKLDWIARGPDLDGGPDNLIVGAIGPSYGGGFQMILNAVDPRKRLDAIVPQITWNDLNYSLYPNGVIKIAWDEALLGVGTAAGSGVDRLHVDPYMNQALAEGLLTNQESPDVHDFYRYHGQGYFCDGVPVATNGGPGTAPLLPPNPPTAIHAMFLQGMRDTLFNFNEAYRNYQCLRRAGGDVRLLSYEGGHNSLLVVPDPGAAVYEEALDGGAGATLTRRCGDIDQQAATLAFFDEHLKGIPGAADAVIPRQICISLGPEDRALVEEVVTGTAGTEFSLPGTNLIAGVAEAPAVADLGYTAPEGGAVLAGIPYLDIELKPTAAEIGEPIVFVGLGRYRLAGPVPQGVSPPLLIDLIDNQITPLRGFGHHSVDLVGVGERLAAGDRLVLLVYGEHDQYHITGSAYPLNPSPVPVTVAGKVWIPLL